jgi:hypothetical protein
MELHRIGRTVVVNTDWNTYFLEAASGDIQSSFTWAGRRIRAGIAAGDQVLILTEKAFSVEKPLPDDDSVYGQA